MIQCDLCDQRYHDRWDGITKGVFVLALMRQRLLISAVLPI